MPGMQIGDVAEPGEVPVALIELPLDQARNDERVIAADGGRQVPGAGTDPCDRTVPHEYRCPLSVTCAGSSQSESGISLRRSTISPLGSRSRSKTAGPKSGDPMRRSRQRRGLLIADCDNPYRAATEASSAALCGTNPAEVSSGQTQRRSLNSGGDRQANSVPCRIVITRLRWDPRAQAYLARRLTIGNTRREAIRCLQRYVARDMLLHIQTTNITRSGPQPHPVT